MGKGRSTTILRRKSMSRCTSRTKGRSRHVCLYMYEKIVHLRRCIHQSLNHPVGLFLSVLRLDTPYLSGGWKDKLKVPSRILGNSSTATWLSYWNWEWHGALMLIGPQGNLRLSEEPTSMLFHDITISRHVYLGLRWVESFWDNMIVCWWSLRNEKQ